MMNKKSLLFFILLLIWCIGCCSWYSCRIKGWCIEDIFGLSGETKISTPKVRSNFFDINSITIDNSKQSELKELCQKYQFDSIIEIEGHYFDSEINTDTTFANIGLARAQNIKNSLTTCLDTSKVLILTSSRSLGAIIDSGFKGFEILTKNKPDSFANLKQLKIVDHENMSELYFPPSSIALKSNPDLDQMLNKYIEKLKAQPNSTLSVEGHTDNKGKEVYNQTISLERARTIQDKFVNKGIDRERIKIVGHGSSKPKVENNSDENRAKNRRVEIIFKYSHN